MHPPEFTARGGAVYRRRTSANLRLDKRAGEAPRRLALPRGGARRSRRRTAPSKGASVTSRARRGRRGAAVERALQYGGRAAVPSKTPSSSSDHVGAARCARRGAPHIHAAWQAVVDASSMLRSSFDREQLQPRRVAEHGEMSFVVERQWRRVPSQSAKPARDGGAGAGVHRRRVARRRLAAATAAAELRPCTPCAPADDGAPHRRGRLVAPPRRRARAALPNQVRARRPPSSRRAGTRRPSGAPRWEVSRTRGRSWRGSSCPAATPPRLG